MKLYAQSALLANGWQRDVLLEVDAAGMLAAIDVGKKAPHDAEVLAGPVVPGMPNLHSHAFQRAFAGQTERRAAGEDSFWTWREVMYEFVGQLTPAHVQAIAEQLYVEMLEAGYTSVAEFHYLHHDIDGKPYTNPAEMSERIVAAAHATGIALTMLPVLYVYGGFGERQPADGQRRFLHAVEQYSDLLQHLHGHARQADFRLGMAAHSLRAVSPATLGAALDALHAVDASAPVHIHIAEQTQEVLDCIGWSSARPVDWLLDNAPVDNRWCLVHATHLTDGETQRLASSGAVAGLCPTTEANLGDGIFPAREYVQLGGKFGIGSDSQISVSPIEELRTLEYGQRLLHQRRALLATPELASVGQFLYEGAARGGAQALGIAAGALEAGRRADLVVLDRETGTLYGKRDAEVLDAAVFAGNQNPVRDVMVGSQWQVRNGRHQHHDAVLERFKQTLEEIRRS